MTREHHMAPDTRGTRSLWYDTPLDLDRRPLPEDARTDVCVVGAGLAGMLCAYSLAREGRRVVVLDSGLIGSGETGRTTAHLSNAIDDRYARIRARLGAEAARIVAESHTAGIWLLERIAADEGIDCRFSRLDGYLFLPPGAPETILDRELAAAHAAGLSGVERVASAPSFDSGPCLRFPEQGQFHPLLFLEGVARAIERMGGAIFTGTRMKAIVPRGREQGLTVRTESGLAVEAGSVIVATNSPVNDLVAIHTKQAAHRTYVMTGVVPAGAVARALYWDTTEQAGDRSGAYHAGYHYVRLESAPGRGGPRDELLIVGGGDHLTGESRDPVTRWTTLEAWARVRWPIMGRIVHRWSGQVQEPLDGVAFIGRNPTGPDGVFIVTGDSGQGMTHSAVAAIMLPELLAGRDHPWGRLYDPARKPLGALGEFAQHAGRAAGHYADWLTPGADLDDLPRGVGRVVRRGLRLIAVHRDTQGLLHARSAACTHLGCVVKWNAAEKSWDCPCHGSRFDALGRVLNGPARRDLARGARAADGVADRARSAERRETRPATGGGLRQHEENFRDASSPPHHPT